MYKIYVSYVPMWFNISDSCVITKGLSFLFCFLFCFFNDSVVATFPFKKNQFNIYSS